MNKLIIYIYLFHVTKILKKMLYDDLGKERINDYNQAIPNYITLNNFYINNNQILSSNAKKKGSNDNFGLNNYNYNNDLNYKYIPTEHMNNFISPKRGLDQMNTYQRRAFFSPPPIQSSQRFKSILSKSEFIPSDDNMNLKKINSGRNLFDIIFENKDGPKDSIRIYKSIGSIQRRPDIIGNSLNNNNINIYNNIKVKKLNYIKNENDIFAKHPLDNNKNFLTKTKYNKVINDLDRKPRDNLRNYIEFNINESSSQSNEKEVNINEDIKRNNNDKEFQPDPVHNIKDESNLFKSNQKGNAHSNWDKIMKKFDKNEDKKSIDTNSLSKDTNNYKDEGKNNQYNIIYNNTRKVNLNSPNNNKTIQNKINLNAIKKSINEDIVEKNIINEDNKDNDIKDDKIKKDINIINTKKEEKPKNDIIINNREINGSIMEDKNKLNNISKNEEKNGYLKNNIINKNNAEKIINDLIGKNKIEIIDVNIGDEINIGNINEDKKKNNNSNINEVENKEIISNIDINNNINLKKENLPQDDIQGKSIIEDTKEKINKNENRINKDNLKNKILNEEKDKNKTLNNIQEIDKNENLQKIDNINKNIIIPQKDNINEDKDNIKI